MEENNSVSPDERSNEELDSLADNDVSRNAPERPMSQPTETAPPKTSKDEYEFVHNGKPVKGTRDQVLKWAQQGYDYPQKAQKLNQDRMRWEQERAQFEQQKQKYSPYQEIDQWAAKNPGEWERLNQLWKQAQTNPSGLYNQGQTQQQGQLSPELQPYISKIQSLEQQYSQLTPILQQWQQDKELRAQQDEDNKLDTEVQSIREAHKDLDWNSLDDTGKNLEMRVLEHAQNSGIPSFRAALRDLMHDDLMSRATAQAKQSVAKGIQNRTKLGVLGESPTPTKGREFQSNKNIRETSYEELENEIREELRRG